MDAEPIPQQAQKQLEEIASADLVVGLLPDFGAESMAKVCDAFGTLSGSPRIVLLQNGRSDGALPGQPQTPEKKTFPFVIPWPFLRPATPESPILGVYAAYGSVFAASEKLDARACCVVASELETATLGWVCQLAQPLLERNLDLVVPRYARRKLEGLLNSSIISPLLRCLYAKRIQSPIGPDLGLSRRLFQKVAAPQPNGRASGPHPLASLASTALCDNLGVCEVHVGARVYTPTDWTNVSSLIVQILSPIFDDMQRNVAYWQRMRGSVPVARFGEPVFAAQDTGHVDVSRMIESFQLGTQNLHEVWGRILPPTALLELRKLARLAPEQFRMPDDLWVRIVYDFALGHRLRTISRDHLLRSITPLYLGWIASYAIEIETAGPAEIEARIERLARAYEAGKPYLVSRWRWPDRFNP